MAIFSRKNIFYLLAFSAILIAVYITFDFFTHKPELSPQFNFEAMKANSFLVVLEPEPNFYQVYVTREKLPERGRRTTASFCQP